MAERQFGPYRLIRQIAVGGMAEIHLAKTKGIAGFEKYVAIKMIHPNFAEDEQFIEMLVDEAKIAVQLTHGNIAQTFDLGRVGDTYYITMEYVDGADLYKILRRASEHDIAMPLDVCAFIAKEVSSALDHAHRKRDHTGKPLGIVHRDVSPQNVLLSYSGEVKLVDFGIAKATMKARQTAVGVIKGKYYYMSPEQAWGQPIDYRSDIFSTGIVLYELITGQMLYLEEDLHKLLEMARAADIAPPSTLRKGVPPQLERIVMHALAKSPADRYQSAADFALDLERFLHAYSPVFTAAKVSAVLRQVLGDPMEMPEEPSIEVRSGAMSTHPLDEREVAHAQDKDELRDENSVIFRMAELKKPVAQQVHAPPPRPPTPAKPSPIVPQRPASRPPGPPLTQPKGSPVPTKIPSIPRVAPQAPRPAPAAPPPRAPTPAAPMPIARAPVPVPVPAQAVPKPRALDEETRRLESPLEISGTSDDSGLLQPPGPAGRAHAWDASDSETHDEDLENIGERTMITAMPNLNGQSQTASPTASYMVPADEPTGPSGDEADFSELGNEIAAELGDGVENTLVTAMPAPPGAGTTRNMAAEEEPEDHRDDDDGPTMSRDFTAPPPRAPKGKVQPPPALSAKIQTPAVSALRQPRASRRTPPGGSPHTPPPQTNVLQQIVGAQGAAEMPAPRPPTRPQPATQPAPVPPPPAPPPIASPAAAQATAAYVPPSYSPPNYPGYPQHGTQPNVSPMAHAPTAMHVTPPPHLSPTMPENALAYPPAPAVHTPQHQQAYTADASGLPLGISTPPPGAPMQAVPGVPPHLQPYLHMQGMPPSYPDPQYAQQQQNPLTPGALYQFQPYGQPPPQPMTITGQMRLFEVDELPSHYKLGSGRRWLTYIFAGLLAISVAAGATFFIIRSTRNMAPSVGTVKIDSIPEGAEVVFDGERLTDRTPLSIPGVPVGTRHDVRVELARHIAYTETIDIPKRGGEVPVTAMLKPVTGKLVVNSRPGGAEIRINDEVRGRTPTTINDVDMDSAKRIELRLKDYQPYAQDLVWPSSGQIDLDVPLRK